MAIGFMNYTFRTADGAEHTLKDVPINEARTLQKSMGLTQKDAMIEWGHRNGKISDAVYAEFDIKVGKAAETAKSKRKSTTRKVDADKRDIIASLFKYLSDNPELEAQLGRPIDTVVIENDQRLVRFTVGEAVFDLTLARKRAPKNN